MKKILLNWCPPSMPFQPAPGLSILKSHIEANGYSVDIKYWNLLFDRLENEFFSLGNIWNHETAELLKFSPYLNYISQQAHDEEGIENIKNLMLSYQPIFQSKGDRFLKKYLQECSHSIEQLIDKEIKSLDLSQYLYIGLSGKFNQWVFGNILTQRIKANYPSIKIVMGGLPSRECAIQILQDFQNYDYALWGENEYSLLKLTKTIDSDCIDYDIENIPTLAYRLNDEIKTTSCRNQYIDLDRQTPPDFSDYIHQIHNTKTKVISYLPIEGSRSCHWRKCKFCYLNAGYKYRTKTPKKILDEIKMQCQKYDIHSFLFSDNDIIGQDFDRFNTLLDLLIQYKTENQKFKIILAEVITLGLDSNLIKKMHIAGFRNVQIGYESPSANLLQKINKKNTFASNFLFIKWATIYGIKIDGLNLVKNLVEETHNDIQESINNLFYLRFYLKRNKLEHYNSLLSINRMSPYFNGIKNTGRLHEWQDYALEPFLPKNYISDRYTFLDCIKREYDTAWDTFFKIEKYYLDTRYDYNLIDYGYEIYYTEYRVNSQIARLSFDKNDVTWKIMKLCNDKVCSFAFITESLKDLNLKTSQIEEKIGDLKNKGLIYCTDKLDEIVCVINTNAIQY